MLKGKWKDFYSMEEVINIPPLKQLELKEEAWKIVVRDTKRYEVAAVQGERVVKERYKEQEGEEEKERPAEGKEYRRGGMRRSKTKEERGKGAGKRDSEESERRI